MNVLVTVFKHSGKYYTQEEIELPVDHHHEMVDHVRSLIAEKKIPGMAEGAEGYHVLVEPLEDDVSAPHLFPV